MISVRKITFGLMAACLLLTQACNELTFNSTESGIDDDNSALTISLSMDGMGVEVATRSTVAAEDGEEDVHSLTLFFFEPSNDRSGLLVDWVKLGDNNIGTILPMNESIAIPTSGKNISASDAYHVIGVANGYLYYPEIGDNPYEEGDWELQWMGKTEADFRNSAIAHDPLIPIDYLLMNGNAVKTAGNGRIDMKLTRNVIRVDVENKASGYVLANVQLLNRFKYSSITGDATLDYSASNVNARNNPSTSASISGSQNVYKGLHAFENRSTNPKINDKLTTCLIVGLKKGSGSTAFYRINIHPEDEGQNLRRNHVYSITITHVNGEGYSSRELARDGAKENELDYTINNWDLGDNGLIVSDSRSILALPVKKAQIGKEGGTFSYNITTFSTLDSPSPLQIKSKTLDAGLTVAPLNGNTLTITATDLGSEEMRQGSVTLTYAGLEATLEIEQSPRATAFLKLTYEDGWSGLFSSGDGEVSKKIFVKASGPWKATIIGDEGFSFESGSTVLDFISSIPNNEFTVATVSANPSQTARRNAFVVVSLDDDPLHCVGVVSLVQSSATNINIKPKVETVIFEGSNGAVYPIPNKNIITFTDIYCYEESESGTVPVELDAIITEGDDRFDFELTGTPTKYTLKVWTKGSNISTSNYTCKLKLTAGGSGFVINLVQIPLSLKVDTTDPTLIGPEGGETGDFNLSIADPSAKWTASLDYRGDGRDIFNHDVQLVYANDNIPVGISDVLDEDTPLKLVFPKIYFPNREIDVLATVTFKTTAGATASYTFRQTKLTTTGVRIWSTNVIRWGSLTPSGTLGYFMEHFNEYIRNNGVTLASPGSYSLIASSSSTDYGNDVPSATNWFQFSNNEANSASRFAGVNKYFNDNSPNKLTVIQAGHGAEYSAFNNYSFAKALGYTYSNSSASVNNVRINTSQSVRNTRIFEFIMEKGRKTISNINGFGLYNDAVNGGITNYPEGAVPLLIYNNPSNVYNLVIDPKNNLVIHGDETVFYGTYFTNNYPTTPSDKSAFMANYIDYLVNAAKYGTHFTEMLIDGSAVKSPYDEVWGVNKWPTRSN